MYYLYVSDGKGGWVEHAKDERKYNLDDIARGIPTQTAVRVTGAEGVWTRSKGQSEFKFRPIPRGPRS